MEIDRITLYVKLKQEDKMTKKKNCSLISNGKKVVPNIKKTTSSAISNMKKQYPKKSPVNY